MKIIKAKIQILSIHCAIALVFLFSAFGILDFYRSVYALPFFSYQVAKTADNPTVYLLSGASYKLAIPTATVLKSYGLSFKDVQTVEWQFLDFYSAPTYLSQAGTNNIYLLQDGKKRFLSAAVKRILVTDSPFLITSAHLRSIATGKTASLTEAQQLANQKIAGQLNSGAVAEQPCQPDPSVGGEDGCVIYQAIKNQNPEECKTVKDANWQMTCWLSFDAGASDPLKYCKNLSAADLYSDCAIRVATQKQDLTLCQNIPDIGKKIECQANVGIANGSYQDCSKLPDFSGDQNVASKDSCLFTFALVNSKPEACGQIKSSSPFFVACNKFASQSKQEAQ